jgi:hypothetical protein
MIAPTIMVLPCQFIGGTVLAAPIDEKSLTLCEF